MATLHVAGSTLYARAWVTDRPAGGDIGTAAATVDVNSTFFLQQTTAGQTLSLPAPTDTTAGRRVVVANAGNTDVTMYGVTLTSPATPQTAAAQFLWLGAAWVHIQ